MVITSKDDPKYNFEEYKGFTIASNKDNVAGRHKDNFIIIYPPGDFPDHGQIVGLDDSKRGCYKKSLPVDMNDAKDQVDWIITIRQLKAIDIKMKDRGYDKFNIKNGGSEVGFLSGVASYLYSDNPLKPGYPIIVTSVMSATGQDQPVSLASFKFVEDAQKGLEIDSMRISLFERPNGPLKASMSIKLTSIHDIPLSQNAHKLIVSKYQDLKEKAKQKDSTSLDQKVNRNKGRKI